MTEPQNTGRARGCGIQGCLFGAVGLFVLLLVTMLVLAAIRFAQRPSGEPAPPPPPGVAAMDSAARP